jgi:GAF domain-containing protein
MSTKHAILTEALDTIRRVARTDRAVLLEVATGAAELVVRCASPAITDPVVVPLGSRSLAGYTAMMRRTVLVDDARIEKRFDSISTQTMWVTRSAVAAPVFGPRGVRAVLVAERTAAHAFPQSEVNFIESVANVMGATLR